MQYQGSSRSCVYVCHTPMAGSSEHTVLSACHVDSLSHTHLWNQTIPFLVQSNNLLLIQVISFLFHAFINYHNTGSAARECRHCFKVDVYLCVYHMCMNVFCGFRSVYHPRAPGFALSSPSSGVDSLKSLTVSVRSEDQEP